MKQRADRNSLKPCRELNSGIRSGLFEKKHSDAMGEAVYLYGWLITRQTKPNGLVFGGHAFTYDEISQETGWPIRTLQRWMNRLTGCGKVEVKYTTHHRMIVWILNPKKRFATYQLELPIATPPHVAGLKGRNSAISGGLAASKVADFTTKSGGVNHRSEVGTEKAGEEYAAKPRAPRDYKKASERDLLDERQTLKRSLGNTSLLAEEKVRIKSALVEVDAALSEIAECRKQTFAVAAAGGK